MAKKDPKSSPSQANSGPQATTPSNADEERAYDAARAEKTKQLVMKTSAMVVAVLIGAYLELISQKFALGIIVAMYAVLRFFA